MMDEAAGLHAVKPALVFHYPGWHQPGAVFEFLLHRKTHDEQLNKRQRALVRAASHVRLSKRSRIPAVDL